MADHLAQIAQAVVNHDQAGIKRLVPEALAAGVSPGTIVNDALVAAMERVGRDFAEGKIFVPEMMVSAMIMKTGLALVKPRLAASDLAAQARVVMATVKGDLHDIGKNIVCMMLEGAGFQVLDLGVDLATETLVAKVTELEPDVLGLSALLTTTMTEMKTVIEALNAKGLRRRTKVIVGGAPVDARFAEKIGADGYGRDAAEAVGLVRRLTARG